jgi:rhodanese-related sulfurtransferase
MEPSAVVILDITLDDPTKEDEFFAWWPEARAVLEDRAKALRVDLLTATRGRFSVLVETAFPGGFKLVAADRPWQDVDARRPKGTLTARELRVLRPKRDISTATLREWLGQRAAGKFDFVLVDALPARDFAEKHIAGASSLPAASVDAATAETVVGGKERTVVVYCRDYTCGASARAALRLHDLGWQNVVEYTPGLAEWIEEGGAIERPPS